MTSSGTPPTKEVATKFRKFAEKHGFPKVAKCKICGNPNKQFTHMAIFELKPYWDFKNKRKSHFYVGICENCVVEAGIKKKESGVDSNILNPS